MKEGVFPDGYIMWNWLPSSVSPNTMPASSKPGSLAETTTPNSRADHLALRSHPYPDIPSAEIQTLTAKHATSFTATDMAATLP